MSTCTCPRFAAIGEPCKAEVTEDGALCLACTEGDCDLTADFGGPFYHAAPDDKWPWQQQREEVSQ